MTKEQLLKRAAVRMIPKRNLTLKEKNLCNQLVSSNQLIIKNLTIGFIMNCPGNPYDSAAPWNEVPKAMKTCSDCDGAGTFPPEGYKPGDFVRGSDLIECTRCEGLGQVPEDE